MRVWPVVLREVISVKPAIVPKDLSSGVATVAAITSGLAPGISARTEIDGKSICGNGAIGKRLCANKPAKTTPSQINVVATGRTMKGPDKLITSPALRESSHAGRAADQRKGKSQAS